MSLAIDIEQMWIFDLHICHAFIFISRRKNSGFSNGREEYFILTLAKTKYNQNKTHGK